MGRQLVAPVSGSPNAGEQVLPFRTINDDAFPLDIMDNRIEDIEIESEEEEGFLDTLLGDGAQSRIVEQVNNWLVDRATENPGCIERFVCETYRTGETLDGIPYWGMQLTK